MPKGESSAVYLCYTRFINTMRQEPVLEQLLPLSAAQMKAEAPTGGTHHGWDYIYEPDAQTVIDELLVRYVEALVYQAVAENMASEQSARMVAMKSATDNAGNVIGELKLVYNKTRQAAITKELSEIVAGAAARRLALAVRQPPRSRFHRFKGIDHGQAKTQTSSTENCSSRSKQARKARSFSVSAPWWTWSFRATRCPRCTTR